MGDVLAGIQATWEFDTDSVLIRFERGIRTPRLFQSLRERRVPYAALSSVTLTPGKRGTVVLRAVPRPGADPLLEAAAGQLKESNDPYRLVLPGDSETLAEYYADELRAVLGSEASLPAERFLVTAPEAPMQFKAYDGRATASTEPWSPSGGSGRGRPAPSGRRATSRSPWRTWAGSSGVRPRAWRGVSGWCRVARRPVRRRTARDATRCPVPGSRP